MATIVYVFLIMLKLCISYVFDYPFSCASKETPPTRSSDWLIFVWWILVGQVRTWWKRSILCSLLCKDHLDVI